MFLCVYAVPLCRHTFIRPSVTCSKNLLSSDQWIRRHVLKFQPRLAKHHRKQILLCSSVSRGRLITLHEASPAALKRFRSVFRDRRRWGSHWSLRRVLVEKGCHRTNRTRARSSRCDVTRGLPDLGRSLTSLVWRCFLIYLLTIVWWQPSWRPIALKDIPFECIPTICRLCASDSRLLTIFALLLLTNTKYAIHIHEYVAQEYCFLRKPRGAWSSRLYLRVQVFPLCIKV